MSDTEKKDSTEKQKKEVKEINSDKEEVVEKQQVIKSYGIDHILKDVEDFHIPDKKLPIFSSGDTIKVYYRTNDKIQAFEGVVIQIKGSGRRKTVTVRKYSSGIGVEKIFPLYSPNMEKIEVNKRGKVRRARIYYMRERRGKKARIKEIRAK